MRLERDSYVLKVVRGRLIELVRDQPRGRVDATIDTTRLTIQALLTRAESLDAILATGRLTITGDTDAALAC